MQLVVFQRSLFQDVLLPLRRYVAPQRCGIGAEKTLQQYVRRMASLGQFQVDCMLQLSLYLVDGNRYACGPYPPPNVSIQLNRLRKPRKACQ